MSYLSTAPALASKRASMLKAEFSKPNDRQLPAQSQSMVVFKSALSFLLLATVLAVVGYQYGFGGMATQLHQLSMPLVGGIIAGLLLNAMLAVWRFQVLASDAGHPIEWRRAMAAVGAGSLAGALFFQIAGQLMARGVVMRRGGVPFSAVVVVTLYERIVAAGVSGLIAVLGALHIFGRVYLDQSAGGGQLVMILCGLAAATGVAGLFGFGNLARQYVWPLLTRQFVMRLFRIVALTLLVQIPMMGVYVALAHVFSPQTPVIDLIAGSAIVMFAASVPVSLGGWGVRELSAVVALGATGVSASGALTTAIIIGAGSLAAMGAIFALSLHGKGEETLAAEVESVAAIDYATALGWIVPLIAAVFVLFQVYLPVRSGLLNVNLADPVVILGASLFVLRAFGRKRFPDWRSRHVNLFVFLATLTLGISLLIGASRFGWNDWALVNRFIGWFVLLSYATTGALITSSGGAAALRVVVLTFVGATLGIIIIELALILMWACGWDMNGLVTPSAIAGFAQNRNAFALQLLLAVAGAFVFFDGGRGRKVALALLFAALWLTGSRSGWIGLVCVSAAAVYFGRISLSEVLSAGILAILMAMTPVAVAYIHSQILDSGHGWAFVVPDLVPERGSTAERVESFIRGWAMFVAHPLFGAGLGAFNQLDIKTAEGIPLVIHSTPLWLLAELGLVGLVVFVGPGLYVWSNQWRLAGYDSAAALISLCFVALAVMAGPADMLYQRTFWLVIGAALSVPVAVGFKELGLPSHGEEPSGAA